jgi:hypothetical protein
MESISWFPWYFLLAFVALLVFGRWQIGSTDGAKNGDSLVA